MSSFLDVKQVPADVQHLTVSEVETAYGGLTKDKLAAKLGVSSSASQQDILQALVEKSSGETKEDKSTVTKQNALTDLNEIKQLTTALLDAKVDLATAEDLSPDNSFGAKAGNLQTNDFGNLTGLGANFASAVNSLKSADQEARKAAAKEFGNVLDGTVAAIAGKFGKDGKTVRKQLFAGTLTDL